MSNEKLKGQFNPQASRLVPQVVDKEGNVERAYDVFSRLLKDRIVILSDQVDMATANLAIAQMQYLDSISDEPIRFYLNSPGGSITAGLAIYDTMRSLSCPVETIGQGMCASMGSFLLSAGTPGMRRVLPNTEVMVHQPRIQGGGGGVQTADDLTQNADHINKTRRRMEYLYAHFMGLEWKQDKKPLMDLMEHDTFLNSTMALKLGLIDQILEPARASQDAAIKEEFDLIMDLNQMELDEIDPDSRMAVVKEVIELREKRMQEKKAAPAAPKGPGGMA